MVNQFDSLQREAASGGVLVIRSFADRELFAPSAHKHAVLNGGGTLLLSASGDIWLPASSTFAPISLSDGLRMLRLKT